MFLIADRMLDVTMNPAIEVYVLYSVYRIIFTVNAAQLSYLF